MLIPVLWLIREKNTQLRYKREPFEGIFFFFPWCSRSLSETPLVFFLWFFLFLFGSKKKQKEPQGEKEEKRKKGEQREGLYRTVMC